MECVCGGEAADFSLTVKSNNSLSAADRRLIFVFIFAISCGISLGFALFGAWLIFPFAGLEILAIYWAFRYVERHASDYERIAVYADTLLVEKKDCEHIYQLKFNRYWAQIYLKRQNKHGSILAVRSHGREIEVGKYWTEGQRLVALQALKNINTVIKCT